MRVRVRLASERPGCPWPGSDSRCHRAVTHWQAVCDGSMAAGHWHTVTPVARGRVRDSLAGLLSDWPESLVRRSLGRPPAPPGGETVTVAGSESAAPGPRHAASRTAGSRGPERPASTVTDCPEASEVQVGGTQPQARPGHGARGPRPAGPGR